MQTERLQGDVEMTVDDMLRLLREEGGLERLSRDASAVSALCWHYCRCRRGKLRLSDSHFVAIFSSVEVAGDKVGAPCCNLNFACDLRRTD